MFVFAYSTHFVMLHIGMHFVHYILYYTKAYMHFEPTKNEFVENQMSDT